MYISFNLFKGLCFRSCFNLRSFWNLYLEARLKSLDCSHCRAWSVSSWWPQRRGSSQGQEHPQHWMQVTVHHLPQITTSFSFRGCCFSLLRVISSCWRKARQFLNTHAHGVSKFSKQSGVSNTSYYMSVVANMTTIKLIKYPSDFSLIRKLKSTQRETRDVALPKTCFRPNEASLFFSFP